ncbi:hypothetical protein D3C87_1037600 [compost metagenome]
MEIFGKDIALNILEYGGYLPCLDHEDIIERIKWYNPKFNINKYLTVSMYENIAFNSKYRDILLYVHYNGICSSSVYQTSELEFKKLKFSFMTEQLKQLLLSSFPDSKFKKNKIYVKVWYNDELYLLNMLIKIVSKVNVFKDICHIKLKNPKSSDICLCFEYKNFNYLGFLHDFHFGRALYPKAKCIEKGPCNKISTILLMKLLRQSIKNHKTIKDSFGTKYLALYKIFCKCEDLMIEKCDGKISLVVSGSSMRKSIQDIVIGSPYPYTIKNISNWIDINIDNEEYNKFLALYRTYNPYSYDNIY